MKKLVPAVLFLFLFSFANAGDDKSCNGGKCTGSKNCTVCKNCSKCKYCSSGGKCGVCSPESFEEKKEVKKKSTIKTNK